MKKVCIFFLLAAISIVHFTGKPPQGQVVSDEFKIGVVVGYDDESIKYRIESYIKTELGKLHDVIIIDPDVKVANYLLFISLVEHRNKIGRKNGDISIATQNLESVFLYRILRSRLSRQKHMELFVDPGGIPLYYQRYISTYLQVGNITDLADLCKEIVVNFDTAVLEKTRQNR